LRVEFLLKTDSGFCLFVLCGVRWGEDCFESRVFFENLRVEFLLKEHLAICEGLSVVEQRKWKTAGRGHHNGTSVHSSALRGHSEARHHDGTGVHISPVSRTVSQVFASPVCAIF